MIKTHVSHLLLKARRCADAAVEMVCESGFKVPDDAT
jgi:hypothetical protein